MSQATRNFARRFCAIFHQVTAEDLAEEAKSNYAKLYLQQSENAHMSKKMAEFYKEGLVRIAEFKNP